MDDETDQTGETGETGGHEAARAEADMDRLVDAALPAAGAGPAGPYAVLVLADGTLEHLAGEPGHAAPQVRDALWDAVRARRDDLRAVAVVVPLDPDPGGRVQAHLEHRLAGLPALLVSRSGDDEPEAVPADRAVWPATDGLTGPDGA